MCVLSVRDSSLFRRVVSASWCALLLVRMTVSIRCGHPLQLWRYSRAVLHGYFGVGARILGSLQRCDCLDRHRCLPVLQELQQALITCPLCRPGCEKKRRKSIRLVVLWILGERKRSDTVELQVGLSRLEDMGVTPDFIASMEDTTLRPSPVTNMDKMRTGTRLPIWSMMYTQGVPVAVAKGFLFLLVIMALWSLSFL